MTIIFLYLLINFILKRAMKKIFATSIFVLLGIVGFSQTTENTNENIPRANQDEINLSSKSKLDPSTKITKSDEAIEIEQKKMEQKELKIEATEPKKLH